MKYGVIKNHSELKKYESAWDFASTDCNEIICVFDSLDEALAKLQEYNSYVGKMKTAVYFYSATVYYVAELELDDEEYGDWDDPNSISILDGIKINDIPSMSEVQY